MVEEDLGPEEGQLHYLEELISIKANYWIMCPLKHCYTSFKNLLGATMGWLRKVEEKWS